MVLEQPNLTASSLLAGMIAPVPSTLFLEWLKGLMCPLVCLVFFKFFFLIMIHNENYV